MQKPQKQLLIRAIVGIAVVGLLIRFGLQTESSYEPQTHYQGLSILVRTPPHLEGRDNITPLVDRFVSYGVRRVWVQVKQDETDEHLAGSVFYPSKLAPIAEGYDDGRLGRFIQELTVRDIQVMAWMPVLHDYQAGERHPQWRSRWIDEKGGIEIQEDWLCPYYAEVADYQAALAREVVARYPELQGLYIDFIRYDDDFACACPSCLAELEARTQWRERMGRPLRPLDVRRAAQASDWLWHAWIDLRAEKIVDVVNVIRDAVEEVRPDFHIGAFVLPFSSEHYTLNSQAGQDLYRLARAGLDEIVLMGYWDDWDLSPRWVRNGLDTAAELVGEEAELSFVLDGDMGVRRTRLTLEAMTNRALDAGWFHYGFWSETEFKRLTRAVDSYRREGSMPRPEYVSLVIRVDTEPDYQPSYDAVKPEMIETLLQLFAEEEIKATFVTVSKLAEIQTEVLRRAVAQGHEIASHAYDHEQIDALDPDQQVKVVDRALRTMGKLGFNVYGFGAPRNSITDESRDRLMSWNLEYDASAAYDPLQSLLDVHYAGHSNGENARIVVIPFVMPNDWDARYVAKMSADEMLEAWKSRLDRVIEIGEPSFVLDIHQWLISRPENLAALRAFIDYARARPEVRFVTLREAARQARAILDRDEFPVPTSGDKKPPLAAPKR